MLEENKAVARRIIEDFFGTGDPAVADEVFAANYVDHNPSNPAMRGRDNVVRSVSDWRVAFPDAHSTVEDVIAEGDKVVVRWTAYGTHCGEFMGIPSTGHRIAVGMIGVFRFSGGKVVESWDQYDALGLLGQLGSSFPPAS